MRTVIRRLKIAFSFLWNRLPGRILLLLPTGSVSGAAKADGAPAL